MQHSEEKCSEEGSDCRDCDPLLPVKYTDPFYHRRVTMGAKSTESASRPMPNPH